MPLPKASGRRQHMIKEEKSRSSLSDCSATLLLNDRSKRTDRFDLLEKQEWTSHREHEERVKVKLRFIYFSGGESTQKTFHHYLFIVKNQKIVKMSLSVPLP